MGKFEDYAEERVRRRLKSQDNIFNQITKIQQAPDTTGTYNDDDNTISIPDGRQLPGSRIGEPSDTDGTLVVGGKAIQAEERVKHTAAGSYAEALFLIKPVDGNDVYVKNIEDPISRIYLLTYSQQLAICGAPSGSEISSIVFSPNGQHIMVGVSKPQLNGDLLIYWGVIQNFDLAEVDGENVVTWKEEDALQGSYLLLADDSGANTPDKPPHPEKNTGHGDYDTILLGTGFAGNCLGRPTKAWGPTDLTQNWDEVNITENDGFDTYPPTSKVTADGMFVFSNDALGNPVVDFIAIVTATKKATVVFKMTDSSYIAITNSEQAICCNNGSKFANICTVTYTTDVVDTVLSSTSGAINYHWSKIDTILQEGCVNNPCGAGDVSFTPTCVPFFGINPCGDKSIFESQGDSIGGIITAVQPTYPPASVVDYGAPFIDPNFYALVNTTKAITKVSLKDLQSGVSTNAKKINETADTYSLTLDSYPDLNGTNINFIVDRYTPHLDHASLGEEQAARQLFRSSNGVIAAVWEGTGSFGFIEIDGGVSHNNYVDSYASPTSLPFLVTDTHIFDTTQADWAGMTATKPIDSELFLSYFDNNSQAIIRSYTWDVESASVIITDSSFGQSVKAFGYEILDYIYK